MRAIQRQLAHPRHVELHRIEVAAAPDIAWQAARHFDGATIPWVRLIFDIRALPARLLGREAEPRDRRLGVDQVIDSGKGFMVVDERPGEEVVVGAVGRFWELEIPFADVTPATFGSFSEPGWGKLAWAIRVEPSGRGSLVTFELRTGATDAVSWRRLDRYFHLIGPMSHLIRSSVMAHLEADLGAVPRPALRTLSLAGDGLIPGARYSLDHAIDIEAPPGLVWPWLMQLGCDRGGWYSIDALDNGGTPSVERRVPEWSARMPGDKIATTPAKDSFYDVLAVEPERLFAIGGTSHRLGGELAMSWCFVLEPLGADATRLITRVRARGTPRFSEWLQGAVLFPPIHAAMQHVQLARLKRLCEHEALAR